MKKNGFSLLEVMISSFILALGLLGVAGLQSTAVKASIEVQQRTLANSLLLEISERMQLNKAWLQESGNSYAVVSLVEANLAKPDCVDDSDTSFIACTGTDIKNNDLFEWRNKLQGNISDTNASNAGLVGADACITSEISGKSTIVISWYSTVKTSDANSSSSCGEKSDHRRQVSTQLYINKVTS